MIAIMTGRAGALFLALCGCLPFWVSLSGAFPFFPAVFLAAISAAVLWASIRGGVSLVPPPWAAALFAWILFECFRADVWDRSAGMLSVWLLSLALGLLASWISRADRSFPARTAIALWCLASFIAALNPLFLSDGSEIEAALAEARMEESYKQAILHSALQGRFHFPFGNPIHLGLFLSLSLLSLPWLYELTRTQARPFLWRFALIATSGAQLYILWGTRARTSLLALGAGAAVTVLLWRRPSRRVWAASILGGALLLAAVLATPSGREMVSRVETVRARLVYWGVAAKMIHENPLLGLGIGGFGNHYSAHRPLTPHQTEFPHQIFLGVAADMGAIGLFLFAATGLFLGSCFLREAKRNLASADPCKRSAARWQCAVATAFLFACQVDFPNNRIYLLGVAAIILSLEIAPPVGRGRSLQGRGKQGAAIVLFLLVAVTLLFREVGHARFEEAKRRLETDTHARTAYSLMTRAASIWPPLWEAHYFQGRMALDAGDLDRGRKGLKEAIRWNPSTAFLREDLARLLWQQGEQEAALGSIRRAIELHPVKWQYHKTLAGWLHEMGRTREAIEERGLADRLRVIEPDYAAEVKRIQELRGEQ